MGKQKNTIIINGGAVDANTGLRINRGRVKTLDGFIRNHSTVKLKKPVVSPAPSSTVKDQAKPKAHAAKEIHKRYEHTKTLMRSTVTKPNIPKLVALASRIEANNDSVATLSVPAMHTELRHNRAKNIAKSSLIRRFNTDNLEPLLVKKSEPLHVKSHPKEHISGHNDTPIVESLAPDVSQTTAGEDMFVTALGHATSHQQPQLKKSHRKHRIAKRLGMSARTANVVASVAIVLALGGFITYQNAPNIAMHMAVAKAGISASLPGYRPSGFAMSHQIKASAGQVVISFHSNSDSRSFNISQSASDWNSQSLVDNYVALNDNHYQRVSQDNGKTVFIYGSNSATWVDGGVWYNITGKSSLSNDQLLKIASSF